MTSKNQNRTPLYLFGIGFLVILGLFIAKRLMSAGGVSWYLPDNSGSSRLLAGDSSLVAVFTDGAAAAWDWKSPSPQPLWQFAAPSDRLVMLDDSRLAAVTKTGKKSFSIYNVKQNQKLFEASVGWEDQDIWLLQSPSRGVLALACINPDKAGQVLYELMTIDPADARRSFPVSIDLAAADKRCIAFAVSDKKQLLAAGSSGKQGLIFIADLEQGKIILEKQYPDTLEFTSAAFTPDGSRVFLTNRNGSVYGMDAASGEIQSTYTVLRPGEKNPVTNETRSDGITISADGSYVAAVVINVVHIWDIQTGEHVFQCSPGHKLTGAIALSPDGSLLATSDIRASGAVRLFQVKKIDN